MIGKMEGKRSVGRKKKIVATEYPGVSPQKLISVNFKKMFPSVTVSLFTNGLKILRIVSIKFN